MYTNNVGSAGLCSSAIGLGSRAFTGAYGPFGRAECIRTIRMALRIGVTMLDTADFYAGGETERLIGEALAGRRDGAVVATRGGLHVTPDGRPAYIDGRPRYLTAACEASLRRLAVDHIDLFYLSRVDRRVPIEESVGGLADIVAAGKIRYIGLGEVSAEELRRAHAVHPVSAVAVEYSLWERSIESLPLGTALTELGVSLVACRPLMRGLLTGRLGARLRSGDERLADPRFSADCPELRALAAEAARRDTSVTRLALAWLLSRRPDVVPVPSTRSRIHLELNAAAVRLRLTKDECDRLARIFAQ